VTLRVTVQSCTSKFGLFSIDFGPTNHQSNLSRHGPKGADLEESFAQNKNAIIPDSAISKAKHNYGIFALTAENFFWFAARRVRPIFRILILLEFRRKDQIDY
jgi:uncharacterized DUF497 family protein